MIPAKLKIAVIAGEVSGDLLGGDLIAALRRIYSGEIELVGVGGEALEAQGLVSLFDYSELSIMGFTQVIARLPALLKRIRQTADAIVAARPDVLLIIDSPDFTHRVAKRVREKLASLPVVNYICPSVWAWKEYRATAMLSYVDHVLAVLPFEPVVMERLGGPKTTFIGHRLASDAVLKGICAEREARELSGSQAQKSVLLLPGSRSAEIRKIMPVMAEAAREFVARNGPTRFFLPTVSRQEKLVREMASLFDAGCMPHISVGGEGKREAFVAADAAIAASGTVILELALAGVPVVSVYKTDWIFTLLSKRIKTWSGALPNLIADYVVVPEYFNEVVRPASLLRWVERLSSDTLQRRAMLEGFDIVRQKLETSVPPGEAGAAILLDTISRPAVSAGTGHG